MKSEISKKWAKYSLINIIVLFVVYGVMLLGFTLFAFSNNRKSGEDMLTKYGNSLALESQENMKAHFSGDENFTYYNADFALCYYERRADGSLVMMTTDDYLSNYAVPLDKAQGGTKIERIGDAEMMSYVRKLDGEADAYIKVLMPMGVFDKANVDFITFVIIFSVVFILVSLAASVAIGYLEIMPIAMTYERQKNFINDMSHEIRTPLAIIKGNLENAILDGEAKVTDVTGMLEESLGEVEHIGDIASGLLNIVKSTNSTSKGQYGNVCQVISEVIDVYSDLSIMHNKSLVAAIDMVNMEADKEKFKQLLVILLENSMKYTKGGDRIKVKFKKTDSGCVLIVSDTGIGVPQEELQAIFDRFYRATNATEQGGTGLGLSIAKAIVEHLGGKIYAKQNAPKGLVVIAEFVL